VCGRYRNSVGIAVAKSQFRSAQQEKGECAELGVNLFNALLLTVREESMSNRGKKKLANLAGLAAATFLAVVLSPLGARAADSGSTSEPIKLAQASSSADTISELRQEIQDERRHTEALEKRLDQIQQQQQTQAKTISEMPKLPEIGRKAEVTPGITTGLNEADIYNRGFFVESKYKRFSLFVNGLFQVRYTLFKQNDVMRYGALDNFQNTFDVFLGRLAFSGSVFEPDLKYFLQIQGSTAGNSNTLTMLDWFTSKTFSQYLTLQVGRSWIPYTYEYYDNPGNYLFADLSSAEYAFLLQRAIGLQASGQVGNLSYAAEVMNSVPALDAGGQQNVGSKMAYLGHLHYDILQPYGYVESDPNPDGSWKPELTLWFSGMYNPVDYSSGFENERAGDRTYGATPSILFRYGYLSAQGTGYYRRTLQAAGGGPSYDSWGYGEQAGYYIVPGKLELAERVTGVWWGEPEISESGGNQNNWFSGPTNFPYHRLTEYSAGVNYYLYGHNAKIQADYSYLAGSGFDDHGFGANRLEIQTQVMF
jgi:phosphate-selective porin OprO and OprP